MTRIVALVALLAAVAGGVVLYAEKAQPAWYLRVRYPLRYSNVVVGHARHYDLDAALLAAVIYRESKFNADAKSDSGAIGLMQLLPSTAEGIAIRTGGSKFVVSDLYEPEINVRYGAYYLHSLMTKYGSARLALAAYNAGQKNVDDWLAAGKGIQFPETEQYVADVLHLRDIYAKAYGKELGATG
ncbi:MAG: lytic transglycosylase domain-containing protein [Actinobacteria bacterium]|nr:MAG: lytic transglycosylase domain-containing protein [Actinomycetota bacterium]